MKTDQAIPPNYVAIERIEISMSNGDVLSLDSDDAVLWAECVDWGLCKMAAENPERFDKIKSRFKWRVK